jgi:hypothetical protein
MIDRIGEGGSRMATMYVLISDSGLNGSFVHGVYSESPDPEVVRHAEEFARGWTGYGGTTVEPRELNSRLPCGGECTRPDGGVWAQCYCYVHRANDRKPVSDH